MSERTTIWIDADACPRAVKEIVFKAARRTMTPVILVANKAIRAFQGELVRSVVVSRDFDAADNYIAENIRNFDIVITADIPLADCVVRLGATALNPRGELYTSENIKDRLSMRDLMTELRGGGIISGGPRPLQESDVRTFAAAFDRILTARKKEEQG
ncbi:MAG: YaiI/YqxD family protein [Deltaproteobacteria bacterium]|nr:YaiI/YqxD family protein [Deltaproteobacteria bacterium]